jgi:cardiolipin synthase A/B
MAERDAGTQGALERHAARHAPLSGCPVTSGNAARLLPDATTALRAILDAVEGARETLHLEYYILEDVRVDGKRLAEALARAARRGVRVAVITDAVGSIATPEPLFRELEAAGVAMREFHPVNPFRSKFNWHLNDRDHRKILVADGGVAFLGGVNLARVYENPPACGVAADPAQCFWYDCALRLEGPAAREADRIFRDTWRALGPDDLPPPAAPPAACGTLDIRVAASAPRERRQLYFTARRAAMRAATSHILLATGYFVPSRRNWRILADAARRGVAVELVLSGTSDIPACLHAARALYGQLLSAGVRIHEVQDGILHAKAATIDGVWSVVGSSNFDRRSFSFNNEVDAVVLGAPMAAEIEALLRGWAAHGREVTLEAWRRRSLHERIGEYSARLWERYM